VWIQSLDSSARATITAVRARKSMEIEIIAIQMAILYAPRGRGESDGPRWPRPPESPPPLPSLPFPGGGLEWPGSSGLADVTSVDSIGLPRLLRLSRGERARWQKFPVEVGVGQFRSWPGYGKIRLLQDNRWYHGAASLARQTRPGIEALCARVRRIPLH